MNVKPTAKEIAVLITYIIVSVVHYARGPTPEGHVEIENAVEAVISANDDAKEN